MRTARTIRTRATTASSARQRTATAAARKDSPHRAGSGCLSLRGLARSLPLWFRPRFFGRLGQPLPGRRPCLLTLEQVGFGMAWRRAEQHPAERDDVLLEPERVLV